jgi:hypothetical protein
VFQYYLKEHFGIECHDREDIETYENALPRLLFYIPGQYIGNVTSWNIEINLGQQGGVCK